MTNLGYLVKLFWGQNSCKLFLLFFSLQVLIKRLLFIGFRCWFPFSLDVGCKEIWCCLSLNKTLIYLVLFPKWTTLKKMHVYRFQFNWFSLSSLMKLFNYDKIVLVVLWPQQCKPFFLFTRTIYTMYFLLTICNELIPSKVYNTIIFVLFIFYEYTLDIHVNSIWIRKIIIMQNMWNTKTINKAIYDS